MERRDLNELENVLIESTMEEVGTSLDVFMSDALYVERCEGFLHGSLFGACVTLLLMGLTWWSVHWMKKPMLFRGRGGG
jgi:hypothetical protein